MFRCIIVLLGTCLICFTKATRTVINAEREQFDNAGTEFIFALPENYALRYNATLIIVNISPLDVSAHVSFTSDTLDISQKILVPYGAHKTVYLPNDVVLKKDEGTTKQSGILVTSDYDVTVQVYNDVHQRSMDGFLALPTRSLGKEYYVMAYDPWIQSQLAVVAIEDDTEIDIIPSKTFRYMTSTIVTAGSRVRAEVNRLQAVQLQCPECDFTGTRIVSNKPIAVMSGNRCTTVPVKVTSCDHLVEQLPPVNQWGKTFVAAPLMGRSQSGGNRFRIMAARYGTEVGIGAAHVNLKPGQYHDFQLNVNETTLVVSNQPILVVQFSSGFGADNITGDPSMTLVPALEQRVKEATFVTYDETREKTKVTNYITIYSTCDGFDDIELDGRQITTIPDASFQFIELTNFCASSLRISRQGLHSLTVNSNDTTFAAILYGFAYYNSFAHPAVMGLRDVLCTSILPDNGTLEHNCDDKVIVMELPCKEMPTELPNEKCDYSACISPAALIAIGIGCGILAVFIETIIRVKFMKRGDYMDRNFYTTKELYHRKAVVRKQQREETQQNLY